MVKSTIVLLALLIGLSLLTAAEIEPLGGFLDRIAQADTIPEPENWTAVADEVFILYEDESFTGFKTRSTRTVRYTYRDGEVEEKMLSEKLEGDEFDNNRDKDENDGEQRSERMSLSDENLPFNPESEGDYDYSDLGMTTIDGKRLRAIEFKALKRDDEHFDGTAWFDPETARIQLIRISYAKNPKRIRHFDATLGFAYIDGYQVMELFEMDIKGRYLLVFKFNFSVRQEYRDIEIIPG